MKKITFATVVWAVLAALTIGFAGFAVADAGSGSSVSVPSPRPHAAYGGANPDTPYGVDPFVPYGVWGQH